MGNYRNNDEKSKLAKALGRVSRRVRELEKRAGAELFENGDQQKSADLMRKKAELIAELPRIAAPYLDELRPEDREEVEERLETFAAGARRSLAIGSVFYMTNLLYDEDQGPGDPNNLEILKREVGERIGG
jgi:hypothetical protein